MEDKIYELMEKMYAEMQKGFSKVDERFEQVDKRFEQVDKRFEQVDKRFEQVDARIDNVANEVKDINKTVLKIEQEHGEKIQALFDGHRFITQTLADHTDRLQRIEEKLETHDIQIHVLKRKIK